VTDKRLFVLVDKARRQRCADWVLHEAPAGWRVTGEPPKRTLDQNSLLWVWLSAFSEQLEWPVNGERVKLSAEEWKDILTAAFRRESQRVAMGLDGGMVLLGMRSSKMSKAQFAEFMEFVMATASLRGVTPAANGGPP
jgi:hypothetical protein